jgi:uncharacterized protein DUF2334
MRQDVEATERTARLHLDRELQAGRITEAVATSDDVLRTTPASALPSAAGRASQRIALKLRSRSSLDAMLGPAAATRQGALGLVDEAPPRILVRVDEFPCATRLDARLGKFGPGPAWLFHELMLKHGVSYLMAIVPRLVDDPLDHRGTDRGGFRDGERELVERMRDDGITLAQHGTSHRTRYASPRRRSEYCGLPLDELAASLDEGRALLDELGIEAEILIPPFNRFDAVQWPMLASRYRVVAGGPESIRLVGLQPSPLWIGDAVYVPSYRPLYGDAGTIHAAIDKVIAAAPGCWVSIVLHMTWEIADGLQRLDNLLERIAPFTTSWAEFLGAVERSRGSTATPVPGWDSERAAS